MPLLLLLWGALLFITLCAQAQPMYDDAYAMLDRVRVEKKQQLENYLQRIENSALQAGEDELLQKGFEVLYQFHSLTGHSKPPEAAKEVIDQLDRRLSEHYLMNYLPFYDILFIDTKGHIFYTIRKEHDFQSNLFSGDLKQSGLAQRLYEQPTNSFVDYEYYSASAEPSAFFVEPVSIGGELTGWIVLQCSINKINSIFSLSESLGRTGEVFLVNQNQQMLTQSRFRAESSILRQHLSAENIERKFEEQKGHKIVTDYRGYRAITSFEVCDVLGAEWLLIAKIDEDEIVTNYFNEHKQALCSAIEEGYMQQVPTLHKNDDFFLTGKLVDMDEYQRCGASEKLRTQGVNTCTAVLLTMPNQFAYLGHASVYDKMYDPEGDLDLLGHMIKRTEYFDVRPAEKRQLKAVIIAPHMNSWRGAVQNLIDSGYLLSQIRVITNPTAESGIVWHDTAIDRTLVLWTKGNTVLGFQDIEPLPTLGQLVKSEILGVQAKIVSK